MMRPATPTKTIDVVDSCLTTKLKTRFITIRPLIALLTLIAIVVGFCGCNNSKPAVRNEADPHEIVDRLLPPISKGEHYLKHSASSVESVWLFGAYNNGRREVNVLVESDGQNVRCRSFWLNRDGKLWCLDIALSNAEWDNLITTLESERVDSLPNLVPDISHAMTYWLKYDVGDASHEACVYGLKRLNSFSKWRRDPYAENWKTIVDCLLELRKKYPERICATDFSPDGSVDWSSMQKTDAGLAEIFDW